MRDLKTVVLVILLVMAPTALLAEGPEGSFYSPVDRYGPYLEPGGTTARIGPLIELDRHAGRYGPVLEPGGLTGRYGPVLEPGGLTGRNGTAPNLGR